MLNIYRCCWPVSTTSHYLPDLPFRGERRTRLGLVPRLRHAGHAETCPAAPINVNAIYENSVFEHSHKLYHIRSLYHIMSMIRFLCMHQLNCMILCYYSSRESTLNFHTIVILCNSIRPWRKAMYMH